MLACDDGLPTARARHPLLFQGQEFSASTPFLYFADHEGELGRLIAKSRADFSAVQQAWPRREMQALLDDPGDPMTFRRCILDHNQRDPKLWHCTAICWHCGEGDVRRRPPPRVDGATLGDDAWVLRYFTAGHGDYLLLFNIGADLVLETVAEPLLAPIEGRYWRPRWSSENPLYGGTGIPLRSPTGVWRIPGHAAIVLTPSDTPV
jgi:maltooligosyltrehalose trehalohydrolase